MNAMNSVLDQVLTSSRVYLAWLALRTPQASDGPIAGSAPSASTAILAPADFNESWTQFTALTTPLNGIPELESPLSD